MKLSLGLVVFTLVAAASAVHAMETKSDTTEAGNVISPGESQHAAVPVATTGITAVNVTPPVLDDAAFDKALEGLDAALPERSYMNDATYNKIVANYYSSLISGLRLNVRSLLEENTFDKSTIASESVKYAFRKGYISTEFALNMAVDENDESIVDCVFEKGKVDGETLGSVLRKAAYDNKNEAIAAKILEKQSTGIEKVYDICTRAIEHNFSEAFITRFMNGHEFGEGPIRTLLLGAYDIGRNEIATVILDYAKARNIPQSAIVEWWCTAAKHGHVNRVERFMSTVEFTVKEIARAIGRANAYGMTEIVKLLIGKLPETNKLEEELKCLVRDNSFRDFFSALIIERENDFDVEKLRSLFNDDYASLSVLPVLQARIRFLNQQTIQANGKP